MKSVAGRVFVAVALLALSVAAYPNHLKAVVVDSDPPPPVVSVVKQVVPVVSAKADVGSGAVYVSADSPLGSAEAGVPVPGSVGGTHISVPSKPGHNQPGLFDGIFNIPISVLQAVNTYLNNRGPVTKPMRRRAHQPQPQPQQPAAAVDKISTPEEQQQSGAESHAEAASSSSSAAAGAAHPGQGPVVIQKRVNYDDIFNIPISVLKSVNQLLNG